MKITASPLHAQHSVRQHPATARGSAKPETTTPAPPPAPSAVVASGVAEVARKLPPGLEHVAARLEAMGAEGRSPGQNNALTRIQRNLQRYADHQGIVPPAPAPSPAAAPAAPVEAATAADPAPDAATEPATAQELLAAA